MSNQRIDFAQAVVGVALLISCVPLNATRAQETESESPDPQYQLAASLGAFGDVYLKLEQLEDAQYNYKLAMNAMQDLVDAHPDNERYRLDLARCKENVGIASLALKDFSTAEKSLTEAVAILGNLLESDTVSQLAWFELARVSKSLFDLSVQRDDDESALRHYREWQDALQEVRKSIRTEARRIETQGELLIGEGKTAEGVANYHRAVALLESLAQAQTEDELTALRFSSWYREREGGGSGVGDAKLALRLRHAGAITLGSLDIGAATVLDSSPSEAPDATTPGPIKSLAPADTPPAPRVTTNSIDESGLPPYFIRKVFYATDRKADRQGIAVGQREATAYFTSQAGDVTYGVCEVSIPSEHHLPGVLEAPSIFRLEFDWNPEKHVTLLRIEPLSKGSLFARMTNSWPANVEAAQREIFVFVHGYNVSFEDAARRTAQIAWDVGFIGPAVMFSWPSQGGLTRYTTDEEFVDLGAAHLETFLSDLIQSSGATRFHLIAHSMGTRVVTQAIERAVLRQSGSGGQTKKLFNQVVLAAPDINAEYFNRQIAPQIIPFTERTTIYVSSLDRALQASRNFHGGVPRLGENTTPIRQISGLEVVDAASVDTSAIGHTYYGDRPEILDDLNDVLREVAVSERGLRHDSGNRWVFVPKHSETDEVQEPVKPSSVFRSGLIPLLLFATVAIALYFFKRKRAK